MLTLLLAMLLAPPGGEVGKGLEPSPTPTSWELELRFEDPHRVEVQLPGESEPHVYWYMLYTVTNRSGRTQSFFPQFQFVTEDLAVHDTDMGISPLVFDTIRERHRQLYKYLVTPTKAIGELRVGDDNARESVAIWRDIDLRQNSFTIYVSGLSGEVRVVKNPSHNPGKPETQKQVGPDGIERDIPVNPRNFTLRKTLEIDYTLPGSPLARPFVEAERQRTRWIMR